MEIIETIPVEAKWSMAAKGLLGVYVASSGSTGCGNGLQSYSNFSKKAWADVGARGRDICKAFNLPFANARDILQVCMIYAVSLLGPEFELETVEESEHLSIGRTLKCPFASGIQEFEISESRCGEGHQSWGASLTRTLNPDYSFSLIKTMPGGYPYCEWVVERKNRVASFF